MLVIGGSGSLQAATLGTLGISLVSRWLSADQSTVHVAAFWATLYDGASDLILGVIIAAMLRFRLQEVAGAEFSLASVGRRWPRRAPRIEPSLAVAAASPRSSWSTIYNT